MGVALGTDPLNIVVPRIVVPEAVAEVSHSSFFAGMPNRVVLSLQMNVDLSPSASQVALPTFSSLSQRLPVA